MPFTAIHPAATLPFFPFSRSRGWRTALVLGALTPDLIRAFPGVGRQFSHSIPGVVLLAAPFAMLLTPIVSRWLVPRFARLPGCESLARTAPSSFPWLLTILGALIGGGTHLIWDLFTHDGPTILHWSFLDTKLMDSKAGPIHLRHMAWLFHSILGCLLLAWAFARMMARSAQGWRALLTGPWIRMALVVVTPLALLFRLRAVDGVPIEQDVILFVRSTSPLTMPVLGATAIACLLVFLWETRPRPIADSTPRT